MDLKDDYYTRLSPDFFYRCEREYPRAVDFVRRYIPLNWPEKKDPIEKNDPTISMSSKELESEVTQILQNVEASLAEDEVESYEDVENSDMEEVDFDVDHALAVLALARKAMEEEKESCEEAPESCEEESESFENVEESEAIPEAEKICDVVPCEIQEESPVEEATEECESQELDESSSSTDISEIATESGNSGEPTQNHVEPPETLDVVIY